jgi:hypothetical protein
MLDMLPMPGFAAAEAADETDTGAFMRVSALRRAALHEHGATPTNLCAEASGWSATRAREQSVVPKHSAPSSELEQPLRSGKQSCDAAASQSCLPPGLAI